MLKKQRGLFFSLIIFNDCTIPYIESVGKGLQNNKGTNKNQIHLTNWTLMWSAWGQSLCTFATQMKIGSEISLKKN